MKQRGMALLVVLLMVAIMATVAVNTQEYWQRAFVRAESQQFRQQAKWTLLGAEQWVLQQQVAGLPPDRVHPGQPWARAGQRFTLDGVEVAYQLRDNQACFNLNTVLPRRTPAGATPGGSVTPGAATTASAARSVSAGATTAYSAARSSSRPGSAPAKAKAEAPPPPERFARRVFSQLLRQQGLSDGAAATLTNTLAAATPLQDSSQLRTLPGVDRALWLRLKPLVCVQSTTRLQVNLNTLSGAAGAELLMALSQGQLSRQQALSRVAARPAAGWPDADRALGTPLGPEAATAFAELKSAVTLGSNDLELLLWTEQPPYRYQLRSRLLRGDNGFRVTERRYGMTD